jgi:hypothetical protein
MIKNCLKIFSVLVLSLFIVGSAQAAMFLDFYVETTIPNPSTVIVNAGVITGTNIPVTHVYGVGTPAFPAGDDFALPAGTVLNFVATIGGTAATDYIKIVNGADTFMTGTFTDLPDAPYVNSPGYFRAFVGNFENAINSAVKDHFGLTGSETWEGQMALLFLGGFPNYALSGNIGMKSGDGPPGTPIPGSVLLLGSGLIALVGAGVRKRA